MGGSFKKITKVVNPFYLPQKIFKGTELAKWTNVPLHNWVSGEKSFTESLRTTGTPIEQAINNWVLNTGGNIISPRQPNSYAPMTKGLPSNSQYFEQQQQLLQKMQAQQQAKIANLRTQAPSYPATVPKTTTTASTTAATAPTTATLAQTKIGDTNVPADLPMDFTYKPTTTTPKVATANTFSLPNMSDIKFGGA